MPLTCRFAPPDPVMSFLTGSCTDAAPAPNRLGAHVLGRDPPLPSTRVANLTDRRLTAPMQSGPGLVEPTIGIEPSPDLLITRRTLSVSPASMRHLWLRG